MAARRGRTKQRSTTKQRNAARGAGRTTTRRAAGRNRVANRVARGVGNPFLTTLEMIGAQAEPLKRRNGYMVSWDRENRCVFYLKGGGKLTGADAKWATSWRGRKPLVANDFEDVLRGLSVNENLRKRVRAALSPPAAEARKAAPKAQRGGARRRGRPPAQPAAEVHALQRWPTQPHPTP